MQQTVQSGPLRFRTKLQLDQLRLAFTERTPAYGLALVGSAINGQSFQFAFGGVPYTEEEFGDILADAYCQLGETRYGIPSGNSAVARF